MRKLAWLSVCTLIACGSTQQASPGGQCPAPPPAAAPAPSPSAATSAAPPVESAIDTTFLRNYAATRGFRLGTPKNGTPTPDSKSVLFLRSAARDPRQSLFETDLATGETRELLAPDAVAKGPETLSPEEKARRERLRITASGFTAFDLSEDGDKVLLSISGRLFVLTRSNSKLVELNTGKGAAIDPRFSPDGARVMYVRDNDLHTIEVPANEKAKPAEVAVTKGGTEAVPHGLAEFAAQEEFGRLRGYWWSPDGAQVLYEEADQSKVEQLTIVDLAHPEKSPDRPFYPRAGKANADVRLGIASTKGASKTTWVDWDRKRLPYVAHVVWSKNAPPAIYVMDRAQRLGQLLSVDVKTGKTTLLVEEKDDAWLNLDASCPRFLPDGSFLWSSERSGNWQLAIHAKDGKLERVLTSGTLGYRELLDVDAEKKVAYVAAAEDPIERRLFAVPFEGAPAPIAKDAEFVVARFAKNHRLYVGYEGSRKGTRRWFARSLDGKIDREIPSVAESPPPSNVEWVSAGAEAMRVAVIRPRSFDKSKKYPVIDAAYGGPHVVVVTADASGFAREQWMADALNAIVLKIDAKGTPFRGRAWERAIKDAFDRVPLDGHVAAIRALGEKLPELDLDRVGVFGWSFGGYFAALAVLKHGDVFKVGVAGAPVVDWRDYDTAYTERYLGMPAENAAVYDAADVTTWAKRAIAPDAPARPLLVFHGTADDNVYFFNSLKLGEALAKAGRPFELVPLPGQTHQLSSATANEIVWGRSVAFLRSKL